MQRVGARRLRFGLDAGAKLRSRVRLVDRMLESRRGLATGHRLCIHLAVEGMCQLVFAEPGECEGQHGEERRHESGDEEGGREADRLADRAGDGHRDRHEGE